MESTVSTIDQAGDPAQRALTTSERLAQSRREIEESTAVLYLNFIWGVRFVFDAIMLVFGFFSLVFVGLVEQSYLVILGSIVLLIWPGAEMVAIVGYFKRKAWCVIPLHIFAAFSLINIPVGTILSILHYLNMSKVRFEDAGNSAPK